MKAEINKDGLLSIIAETEMESYALGRWHGDNWNEEEKNILFDWSLEPIYDISIKDRNNGLLPLPKIKDK